VRLLLDTHAVVWWLADDPRLSAPAREAIAGAALPLLSAVSLMEIGIKTSLGKLKLESGWVGLLLADGFGFLAIEPDHALVLGRMPFVELAGTPVRDPFDRLLAAQAAVERVPVVTRDPAIAAHGVATVW
jgi:PIN domain nuclease of toxin-antitoxin system